MRHWRSDEERLGGLMWGIGLVLLGTVILLQYLDVMPFTWWHDWWPLVVMLFGVSQIVTSRRPKGIGSGVSILLIGGWLFVATNHVWGLTWHNSWPLALVASGVGMVVRSIAVGIMRRDDGVTEVRNDG
jgi:LiaF transmembrane domain